MTNLKISNIVGNYILTRSSINNIFAAIEELNEERVTLDFSDILFISQSSADEYFKLKEQINKRLVEINLYADVKSMLETVDNFRISIL